MAQPYRSQKDVPNYGAGDSAVSHATPLPPRRRFGFFKTFAVALALLELAWFNRRWIHKHWDSRHRRVHATGWAIDIDTTGLDHGAEGCAVWDPYDPDKPFSHINEEASTTTSHTRREVGDKFSFSIPTSSTRYHFVSWGQIDKSGFEVVPVKSHKDQIVAEVEILKDPRGTARVCALPSTDEGVSYGVGIYTPRGPFPDINPNNWPAFKVVVYIPILPDGSQRNLNALETRLGIFEHLIPDLSQTINFSKLQLSALNASITSESVVANSVHVSNVMGPITGDFTSATNLTLTNIGSLIRGNLTLTQAGNLRVSNSNGPVDINVHLKSGDFHPRPDYYLALSNSKAPISISIAEQPIGSGFFLKASNTMSSIRAHLHAAFEGNFELSNMFHSPVVEFVNHKDPSGEGRERYLQFYNRGLTTSGRIAWGRPDDPDMEHAPGDVTMSTIGAPLELYFD